MRLRYSLFLPMNLRMPPLICKHLRIRGSRSVGKRWFAWSLPMNRAHNAWHPLPSDGRGLE